MDWIEKIFKNEKKYYSVTGDINYDVDVTFSGLLPYCDSSIVVKAFSNSNKKIAIGCKIYWYVIINGEDRHIDNKNLNYLHLSSELVGMQIKAVLEPVEDLYKDKATINFFTVKLDRNLTKSVLGLKPTNNALNFDKVEIYVDNKRTYAANFNLFVNDTVIKINNYYQDLNFQFPLTENQPIISNRYYEECIVEFTVGKDDCDRFINLNEYFHGAQRRSVTLNIRFDSRIQKEQFLTMVRHLQFRNYIKKESYLTILKSLNEDSINMTNQIRLLNQENIYLYNQIKNAPQVEETENVNQQNKDAELNNLNREFDKMKMKMEEVRSQNEYMDKEIETKTQNLKDLENQYLDLQNSLYNLKNFGNKNNKSKNSSQEANDERFVSITGIEPREYEKLFEENKRLKFEIKSLTETSIKYVNSKSDIDIEAKLMNENKALKRELLELSKSKMDKEYLLTDIKRLKETIAQLENATKRDEIDAKDRRLKNKDFEIAKLKEQNERLVIELVSKERN